jgi:hypothetical protein
VTVAAAQIGPNQAVRDHYGVVIAGAVLDEKIADETAELVVADRSFI